jgi:putative transposase
MGFLLKVVVLPANVADRDAARTLLDGVNERFPDVTLIWADQGYVGQALAKWVKQELGCRLGITKRFEPGAWLVQGEMLPPASRIPVEPRRWVVERTFAWEGRNRRLAKDYEGLCETEEALCYLGMVHLMLKRLTR